MSDLSRTIIIAGPTTTGKSEISELLARKVSGAIINTDNYYYYMDEDFHIGLGLNKDEPPKDIPSYMFGTLHIREPKPNTDEMYIQTLEAAEDALAKGYVPILQGCSFTLNNKLIAAGFTDNIFIPIWATKDDLQDRCSNRTRQMLSEGLLKEAQTIIDKGLDHSWIAEEGIIYNPTINYLKSGPTNQEELISQIVKGITDKAEEQEQKYRKLENVSWITHHNDPQDAYEQILKKLNARLGSKSNFRL